MDLNHDNLPTTALAYLGDAVWETEVRLRLIAKGFTHVDRLHSRAVGYVSAEAQEKILQDLLEENEETKLMSEEELLLIRRAKNHRLVASKKNSKKSIMTDKYATAFEALIGYLYLREDKAHLRDVIKRAFELAEKNN